jgi:hypothetical protein
MSSGLYYKHMTIVNDNSSVISKWSSKLIDDARGVIYDHHMFIIQATGRMLQKNYAVNYVRNGVDDVKKSFIKLAHDAILCFFA